ncbi:MAG: hypothetical protein JNK37_03285 [Verrucomicrobiales bacterium]|nr:hypothetical protein [Verrucomicrobiales bacterium]
MKSNAPSNFLLQHRCRNLWNAVVIQFWKLNRLILPKLKSFNLNECLLGIALLGLYSCSEPEKLERHQGEKSEIKTKSIDSSINLDPNLERKEDANSDEIVNQFVNSAIKRDFGALIAMDQEFVKSVSESVPMLPKSLQKEKFDSMLNERVVALEGIQNQNDLGNSVLGLFFEGVKWEVIEKRGDVWNSTPVTTYFVKVVYPDPKRSPVVGVGRTVMGEDYAKLISFASPQMGLLKSAICELTFTNSNTVKILVKNRIVPAGLEYWKEPVILSTRVEFSEYSNLGKFDLKFWVSVLNLKDFRESSIVLKGSGGDWTGKLLIARSILGENPNILECRIQYATQRYGKWPIQSLPDEVLININSDDGSDSVRFKLKENLKLTQQGSPIAMNFCSEFRVYQRQAPSVFFTLSWHARDFNYFSP